MEEKRAENVRDEARIVRLRRDVEAYRRRPQTRAEVAMARSVATAGLEDDTDWAALYALPADAPQKA